jgi:hypothetical protein
MWKYEETVKLMRRLSKEVIKKNYIWEHSLIEYFHFLNQEPKSINYLEPKIKIRHFNIKTFNNFGNYNSEANMFFVTGKDKKFHETTQIARIFSPQPYPLDTSILCHIESLDTVLVTEAFHTDATSVPLLPLAAGLVLQNYLTPLPSDLVITPCIDMLGSWPLLLDQFPMYKVYDDIYLLLDAELMVNYTTDEKAVIQYEFAKSLSKLVAVNNSPWGMTTLTEPNKFTIDKLSLAMGLQLKN